jgi:hypothetical protein
MVVFASTATKNREPRNTSSGPRLQQKTQLQFSNAFFWVISSPASLRHTAATTRTPVSGPFIPITTEAIIYTAKASTRK